ncbi:type IV pilus secretin PilQ [Salinicola sp. LHM]|uniref:type IV pilus secretin PilQ n=1 Tax=Salinicola sp. LHM TaxID=3065298 RepID=UPI002ACE4A8C|nr:type IV pilus secretin PilQ [Salinicola sp. LHM]MED5500382.1 type IV pilus secretin PilQ [Pseudomonadota bacterium]WQH33970.1 type IV pilus secretin PilQ [Salinicola sp. LHM]
MTSRRRLAAGLAALTLWGLAFSAWAAPALTTPTLTAMTFTDQGAGRLDVGLDFVGGVPEIRGYRTEAPPRLALDLLQARSGLTQSSFAIGSAGVDSVRVLGAGARTRLVFDLASPIDYRLERLDDKVIVHFGDGTGSAATDASPERSAAALPRQPEVTSIDFRRGEDGAGQLDLALDRAGVAAEVSGQGRQVSVSLPGVTLPDAQYQTLDVSDFGTAVERIVPRRSADGVTFDIVASDAVEPLVTQNGRRFTIELAPAGSIERPETDAGPSYTGHRITLDFQDIPVRDVLSIIAEESGLNVVASDSVQGNVTLNLTDVPWDQALDLVLRNHGLSARREGNVMMVAPTGELANLQRQTLETREQTKQLAPLTTEFLQIRYAKAEDLAALLRGGEGVGMMSERGRVTVDSRTNTLILQDTRAQLDAIRRTLEHLDVPVRQVQIEARIVIARDSATRELGVNWGLSSPAGRHLDLSGAADGDPSTVPTTSDDPDTYGGGLAVDLGNATNPASAFSFGYLSGDILIDLELRALESEGKSQTISQPKVITANQRTAIIKQGQEVPYQEASSSGATSTEFKEAVLSLEVTPQITPDDRIIMDLRINNDDISDTRYDDAPAIDTNEIQTQVLVNNGETVVLGGILTSEQLRTLFKTPFLGDLPVIGNLFRYTQNSNEKVELLVFITPKIIEDGLAIR